MDLVNNCNNFIHIIANTSENVPQKTFTLEEIDTPVITSENNVIQSVDSVLRENEGVEEDVADVQQSEDVSAKLQRICRCCLIEDNKLRDIFEEGENIVEMLMNFAQIQIRNDDILPPLVCFNCTVQIGRIFDFKNQVEMAETTLRHFVSVNSHLEVKIPPTEDTIPEIEYCEKSLDIPPQITDSQISEESNCGDCPISPTETVLRCPSQEVLLRQEVEVIKLSSQVKQEMELKSEENLTKVINFTERKESDLEALEESSESKTEETEEVPTENKSDILCLICNKGFSNKKQFQKHFKNHVLPPEMTNVRDNASSDEENETVNEDLAFKCLECSESFRIESDLEIHNSLHAKNGKKQCSFCKKEVSTIVQLKRHIKTHFADKPYKCKVCNKGFPEMGSLTRHFRNHSGEQRVKKHLCTVCGKGYYDSHSLSVHTRNHTGERPCICSVCGKTFVDSRLLNSHMKTHSEVKPYKCNICQRRFTHQSTLTTHRRTHTGEKPYVCPVCGKAFIQSSNLSLHMRTHNGVKPYKCETCGRAFASSSTLITHNRIHTGEKPYKCGMCGKAFARLDLSAHIRTHTGEKPFKCTTCHKKFTTRGQLNQHMRVHREEKPLICPICQKRCYSHGNLKNHIKTHETAESVPASFCDSLTTEVIKQTTEDVILYAKSDINPLIVQQIHLEREESNQGANIGGFHLQEIVEDDNQLSNSQLSSNSDTAKYIVSNVIQVPIFISASECNNVENIDEII